MMKLLLIPLLLALGACAALGPVNQLLTTQKNPIVQAGIDLAVGTAIGNNPSTMKARAVAIKAIAQGVLAASNTPTATVAELESVLNARVLAVAPNPADRAAFMVLTATLEGYLTSYIQATPQGALTSQTLVAVSGLASAVILATSFYGA